MIRLLSKETIDKIAAGEVVERPENVARELLDNALDSGALAVSVEIRGGGIDLIRVTDNGCGIEKKDLPNAFLRHATSKLQTAEDLFHIQTMGFRGEALASIAGVARVELLTKRKEDTTGSRYIIEGGKELSLRDVGIPNGTTVIIRDLFFNIPVRRQFLKSARTEGSYVRDIVEKAALARPDISFSFLTEGKQLFHTSGNGKLQDVIYMIYGKEVLSHLIPVNFADETGKLSGFISEPGLSRTRRDSEIYFVNGRFVKSSVIERAVETAYEGYLMQHRFPFMVLSLELPPEKVDVNIHPKKTEVRFSDDERIFDLLFNGIKKTLRSREHIEDPLHQEKTADKNVEKHLEPFELERKKEETVPVELPQKKETLNSSGEIRTLRESLDHIYQVRQEVPVSGTLPKTGADSKESGEQLSFLTEAASRNYRFIGQIFETYWLIEYQTALYIIDQHAAHEKVNFEKLMQQLEKKEPDCQYIIPVLLTLPSRDASVLEDHLEDFKCFGYEIEPAGDRDFYVRAVPAALPELSRKDLLLEMIGRLSENPKDFSSGLLREKIASMSCKAAVKGNNRLSEPEMRALTEALLRCQDPYNCPHGRPVMIRFSKTELDRMFKRIL